MAFSVVDRRGAGRGCSRRSCTAGFAPAPTRPIMTATAETEVRRLSALVTRYYELHPTYLLIVRWTVISALTGVVFRESFYSIGVTAHREGVGGYVWTVPTVAILVAVGVTRRHRTELPIHDRQTDIIVGTMGLVLALLIQLVLLQRYA